MDKRKILYQLTVKRLRQIAKELNIKYYSRKNKSGLIDSIIRSEKDFSKYLVIPSEKGSNKSIPGLFLSKFKSYAKYIPFLFFIGLTLLSLFQLLSIFSKPSSKTELINDLNRFEKQKEIVDSKINQANNQVEKIEANLNSTGNKLAPVVYFDFNSYDIRQGEELKLKGVVPFLNDTDEMVFLGYADEIGKDINNLELSERRAKAVQDFFKEKKPFLTNTRVIGFGEKRPIGNQTTDYGRSLNRRVAIKVKSHSGMVNDEDDFMPFIYIRLEELQNEQRKIDDLMNDIIDKLDNHAIDDKKWYNDEFWVVLSLLIGIAGSISSLISTSPFWIRKKNST